MRVVFLQRALALLLLLLRWRRRGHQGRRGDLPHEAAALEGGPRRRRPRRREGQHVRVLVLPSAAVGVTEDKLADRRRCRCRSPVVAAAVVAAAGREASFKAAFYMPVYRL